MKSLLFLIFPFLVFSCKEYEEPIDNSLKVGSLYCSDGSTIVPELYPNSGKTPIGVVFWINDKKDVTLKDLAYAVSLEDLEDDFLIVSGSDISTVSENETSHDGASNTAGFILYAASGLLKCPAATKVVAYTPNGVTGWYLPSVAQAKLVSANLGPVYSSLELANGDLFSGWYWTSTEDGTGEETANLYALTASLQEGRVSSSLKHNSFKIRPVISIR